ncbi:MAG: bifunctional diaminohydroxyphosphoribosylaminopyrimidine deaminase/5-amino-6-(5-phosphoribosylamino)uracil reductase RibD [Bacteroidetes bacterium]|nr:bifunctional diaminohydroxyphosphoribosylaminopyrimidine deaminase/5-amino-6-(5-phosphoribosylamino)uracil reductase RibD [Bacteroidota bacterium]
MNRCLNLAQKALGDTHPNPIVGAVVVYDNQIIGEGWHKKAGTPHAEVHAINAVEDKTLLPKSTLYVNLEPCSHSGKTPPCADFIINHKIKKVVYASKDPNPLVAGQGKLKLKNAGIEVVEGVLQQEAEYINRRFYTFHQEKRPYILLKWAQSRDGFIAPLDKNKKDQSVFWISSPLSKQKVHQWRSEEVAILIGVQTVLTDNPSLTTREWPGNNPLRIIMDPNNRIPEEATVLQDTFPTLVVNRNRSKKQMAKNKEQLQLSPYTLEELLNNCYEKNILSILVEGGQKTLQSFIENNLWDEVRIFTSNTDLLEGVKAPQFKRNASSTEQVHSDKLNVYFR